MSSLSNDLPHEKFSNPALSRGSHRSHSVSNEFICKLCNRQQVDPRVLACFHSFCLNCLRDWLDGQVGCDSSGHINHVEGNSDKSEVSGYESDIPSNSKCGKSSLVTCPECRMVTRLPLGGLATLPPHYILQHRMLLVSLNQESVCFFCDICTTDIPAVARCRNCLLNLCLFCSEGHKRQHESSEHVLVNLLEEGRVVRPSVTAVRRQLMCTIHPDKELTLFCSACEQIVCRECCVDRHQTHPCDIFPRVVEKYFLRVREKLEKVKLVKKEAKLTMDKLNVLSRRIELRCSEVEAEIENYIELYRKALEEHRKQLLAAAVEARCTKLQVIAHRRQELARSLSCADQAFRFAVDLINEGSDTEVLSFAPLLVSRFDECLKKVKIGLPDLKALETINFLSEEKAGTVLGKQVFGVVTTQRVSAFHSTLQNDGLLLLNNARQRQTCEVILVARDSDGQPLCHGGELVKADLRYRDITRRSTSVSVMDRQDGTYVISFIPDTAGNMLLSLTVGGTAVKGSPFPVCVRTLRAHYGTFHCCAFCSSGGKKDVTCGCGGYMPGGYKGCGHGHVGHPGRRHWSCCGSTLHISECERPSSTLYHLSM